MTRARTLSLVIGLGVLVMGATVSAKSPSLVGVWRISKVVDTGPHAETIANPRPGVLILTKGQHYSLTLVTSDKPRAELPSKPTNAQLLTAFKAFVANEGTYAMSGNDITFTPTVAKNPNVMQPGHSQTGTYTVKGDTLTITMKNQAGDVSTATWTRVE